MPACVLRVSGKSFDVDAFLARSPFKPEATFRKGEPRKGSRESQDASGFNLTISDADSVRDQIAHALEFLEENRNELVRLLRSDGVDGVVLDFAAFKTNAVAQSERFPSSLLVAAGMLGVDIQMTYYLEL